MPAFDKAISLCQLAIKAGKTIKGDFLIPSIQKQQARLVLLSEDCGANRKKKVQDKCRTYNVPLIELKSEEFSRISPSVRAAIALTDQGFADGFCKMYQASQAETDQILEQ